MYLIKIKEKGKIYLIASQMNSWLHSIALMECRDKISKFCQQRLSSYDVDKSVQEILYDNWNELFQDGSGSISSGKLQRLGII